MKASPVVRAICGVLGLAGAAAIAGNAFDQGRVEPDFMFFSSLLGAFFFLYVAFYGELPVGEAGAPTNEEAAMSEGQWRVFWAAFLVSAGTMTYFLYRKGVFETGSLVVLLIVGACLAIVGVAIYFYVKGRTDDFW